MSEEGENQAMYPQQQNVGFTSPMNRLGDSILVLTDPSEEVRQIELTLRSLKEGDDGKLVSVGEPLLNTIGVSSVIGICKALVARTTVMSNLDDKDVSELMMSLVNTLTMDLMANHKVYGIKNIVTRDKIWFTVTSLTYVTLKRGYKQGEKIFLSKTTQDVKHTIDDGRNGGILSKMNPWSKRN